MSEPQMKRSKRSVGRPVIEHVRDQFISVRVTTIEKVKFLEKAHRSGVDPTEYARSRILRGIARKKAEGGSQDAGADLLADALRQGWHELRKIGVNLNQLAHHCNRHQVPPPAEFHQLVATLLTLLRRLVGS